MTQEQGEYFRCRGCGEQITEEKAMYVAEMPLIRQEPAVFHAGNGCVKRFSIEQGPVIGNMVTEAPVSEIADAVEKAMRDLILRP